MMRKPHVRATQPGHDSPDLLLATIDRLNRERAELLEEVRQLRAAVAIYRRIAEQAMATVSAEQRTIDAA